MWLVELAEDAQIHTYGRTLAAARAAMHQAASLWARVDPDDLELTDDIALPPPAQEAINAARQRRQQAETARDEAVSLSREAARYLVGELDLTVRDAADLLALSPSRISQLLAAAEDGLTS